jgi:hypothetical protein
VDIAVRWRTHITPGQPQPSGRPDPSLAESTAPKLRTDVRRRRPQPRNRHGETQLITLALAQRTTATAVKSHHPRFVSGTYDNIQHRDRPHPPDTGTGHCRIGHHDSIAPLSSQIDPVAAEPQPSRARAGAQQGKHGEGDRIGSHKTNVRYAEVAWPVAGCREQQGHGLPPDNTDYSPEEADRGRRDHITPRRPPKHHITRHGGVADHHQLIMAAAAAPMPDRMVDLTAMTHDRMTTTARPRSSRKRQTYEKNSPPTAGAHDLGPQVSNQHDRQTR